MPMPLQTLDLKISSLFGLPFTYMMDKITFKFSLFKNCRVWKNAIQTTTD
jgi:hypothetical protein